MAIQSSCSIALQSDMCLLNSGVDVGAEGEEGRIQSPDVRGGIIRLTQIGTSELVHSHCTLTQSSVAWLYPNYSSAPSSSFKLIC